MRVLRMLDKTQKRIEQQWGVKREGNLEFDAKSKALVLQGDDCDVSMIVTETCHGKTENRLLEVIVIRMSHISLVYANQRINKCSW